MSDSDKKKEEEEKLDSAVEQSYNILADLYRSCKIQNHTDTQILFILNTEIAKRKLQVKQITAAELVMFEQDYVNKSAQKFGSNRVSDLVASRVHKIDKLELIEKNLWHLTETNEISPTVKAKVYGHLADVVLKEKELEDELVRLLD